MEGSSAENENVRFAGEETEEKLKMIIKSHPLYGLLVETHLQCLKVGLGEDEEAGVTTAFTQADKQVNCNTAKSSELDNFMEDYCTALNKLKEGMVQPLQETTSFINNMYVQLSEIHVELESTSTLREKSYFD
ncbi:hypothetical protein RJ639_022141 [Escallonia herrerae]|uniref:Uncharacterized protein n=1 Tax=Escallonia herrerae TaxID=1293975 RepID=A0AA88V3J2_9ASTE|nr:hypothetical protein RJ639_022141 [Escallonia herrerae]